jgi:hypothetical protein
MEHPINTSIGSNDNDPNLSATALIVALGLLFALYFTLRLAVPDLPLHVHHALAELPWESAEAGMAVSLLR